MMLWRFWLDLKLFRAKRNLRFKIKLGFEIFVVLCKPLEMLSTTNVSAGVGPSLANVHLFLLDLHPIQSNPLLVHPAFCAYTLQPIYWSGQHYLWQKKEQQNVSPWFEIESVSKQSMSHHLCRFHCHHKKSLQLFFAFSTAPVRHPLHPLPDVLLLYRPNPSKLQFLLFPERESLCFLRPNLERSSASQLLLCLTFYILLLEWIVRMWV